ncbi:luc7-like protein 3 isoform X1 [Penaeus vannamei]|uniref:luc7-like protein 3 isoform X1 n=2 Tax=Penaeus TaxID=133894 RepID=UPI000F67E568|nr:luc7-like protein 3 isoform X1 [Penaeus vannamei]XP_027230638.1 luc7-like protein 3 isoform X1 [Penaeus vannamei]
MSISPRFQQRSVVHVSKMATQAAAALLDELMGRSRNVLPEERNQNVHWDSPEVCRHYLVKFCPHDLFTNTKSDLGPCDKPVHDEELKREFEAANSYRRTAFEDEFVRYAESMLTEVDKRIRKGKQRLSLSVKDALASSTTGDGRVDEQLELLSERITGLVSEAERLGSEGNVEEAQGLLKLCDQLREERDSLRRSNENSVWHQAAEMAASQEKQMEVCEVCGAFLIVGDAQQRIDDHLTGKQHVGFAKLRQAIQEIRDSREKARAERESQREKEREERRKALQEEEKRREKEREERRRKDEDRRRRSSDRDRDRERAERSRDRDRDRMRDRDYRDRRRSRSRDRERRRSRSRDRDYRSSHSKDRDRREKDRDRHHRSRSREHDRRRHREENGDLYHREY